MKIIIIKLKSSKIIWISDYTLSSDRERVLYYNGPVYFLKPGSLAGS